MKCTIIVLTIIIIIIAAIYILQWNTSEVIVIDGFKYYVDPKHPEKSGKLMAKINSTSIEVIKLLRDTLEKENNLIEGLQPSEYVMLKDLYENLRKNYNPDGLRESIIHPFDPYTTSYTQGKGEKLCMCMKNSKGYHRWPTIFMVLLHELTHMGCTTWSFLEHNSEFWTKYHLLCKLAGKAGMIDLNDLPEKSINYCDRVIIHPAEFMAFKGN